MIFLRTTRGFSIIEISIALMIASFLTLALYQAFNNTQRNSLTISATMNAERAFSIAYNQVEKDISTLFVPERIFRELASSYEKNSETTQEKKKESFKNFFVSTEKDKNLGIISFVSTNTLPLYNSKSPYIVRVVYRLVQQEDSNLFALTRQESSQFDLAPEKFKEKNIRAYELMNNIKSCNVRFTVHTIAEDEKEQQKKYSELAAWPQQSKNAIPEFLIPAYVTFKGIFIDVVTEREYLFEWLFPVFAYDDVMNRLEKLKQQKPKELENTKESEKKEKKPDIQQKNVEKKEKEPKNKDNKK